jgi:biotin transport system permease protein
VNPLGLYVPGDSPVHRLPAAVKLLLLVALGVASVFLRAPVPVGGAIVIVIACYAVAGLSPAVAIRQVWPMRWILVFILAFQWWARGWQSAVVVVGVIAVLVMAAALVTLTTRTSALVDVLVSVCRPLRVVGVDPDRVGLVIALAIRSVPIVAGFATQIRDAQRARGARPSPRAYAAPLIVRSLRHADAVGEALAARGLD